MPLTDLVSENEVDVLSDVLFVYLCDVLFGVTEDVFVSTRRTFRRVLA